MDGWEAHGALTRGLRPIEADQLTRTVEAGGKPVTLTRTEFDLLALLVAANGGTLVRDEIVQKVAGTRCSNSRQALRRTISSLRHKIESDPAHPALLLSVRGTGYLLKVCPGYIEFFPSPVSGPARRSERRFQPGGTRERTKSERNVVTR
jgi:hypothetical protein